MLKRWLIKNRQDKNKSLLENLSIEFEHVFGRHLPWCWDERYQAVCLTIDSHNREKVIRILEKYFSDYWSVLADEKMPPVIENVVRQFDGLGPEQLLFSTDVDDPSFVYCAWWPWQNSEKASIRLAYFMDNVPDAQQTERVAQMKQWFNIAA